MALTILSEETIRTLLSSLTKNDIMKLLESLEQALSEYSSDQEKVGYASRYQPQQTGIISSNGQSTLFMPFTSPHTIGAKVIGLESPGSSASTKPAPRKGAVTLLDASGNAKGLLSAEELTAFSMSLSSMILFKERRKVDRIVVFGAGQQALWHIRLALIMRGEEVEKITVVSPTESRSKELFKTLAEDDHAKWAGSKVEFEALDPLDLAYWRRLEERLVDAEVVFCCESARRPLFPPRYLASEEKRKRGCYITAIGSHSAAMVALDPRILNTVANGSSFHPLGREGGAIAVDSTSSCLSGAGEIIQGKIEKESLVDVGLIIALNEEKREEAKEWLASGFVIYKVVGIAVIDATVANELLDLASKKGVGVSIPDF